METSTYNHWRDSFVREHSESWKIYVMSVNITKIDNKETMLFCTYFRYGYQSLAGLYSADASDI